MPRRASSNEWYLVDRDQRAFLRLGLRFARETYDRIWEETGPEPGDPDASELPDAFESKVESLWPHDLRMDAHGRS